MTTKDDARIEWACEVMHDAYERAAIGAGWQTNPSSRKPWADVPEANKVTMRAAVAALLSALGREVPMLDLPPDIEAAMGTGSECLICGGPDSRHRVLDAITGRVRAGDSEEDVAADYSYPLEVVGRIVACWDDDNQRWNDCTHRRLRQITRELMQCEDCGAGLDS